MKKKTISPLFLIPLLITSAFAQNTQPQNQQIEYDIEVMTPAMTIAVPTLIWNGYVNFVPISTFFERLDAIDTLTSEVKIIADKIQDSKVKEWASNRVYNMYTYHVIFKTIMDYINSQLPGEVKELGQLALKFIEGGLTFGVGIATIVGQGANMAAGLLLTAVGGTGISAAVSEITQELAEGAKPFVLISTLPPGSYRPAYGIVVYPEKLPDAKFYVFPTAILEGTIFYVDKKWVESEYLKEAAERSIKLIGEPILKNIRAGGVTVEIKYPLAYNEKILGLSDTAKLQAPSTSEGKETLKCDSDNFKYIDGLYVCEISLDSPKMVKKIEWRCSGDISTVYAYVYLSNGKEYIDYSHNAPIDAYTFNDEVEITKITLKTPSDSKPDKCEVQLYQVSQAQSQENQAESASSTTTSPNKEKAKVTLNIIFNTGGLQTFTMLLSSKATQNPIKFVIFILENKDQVGELRNIIMNNFGSLNEDSNVVKGDNNDCEYYYSADNNIHIAICTGQPTIRYSFKLQELMNLLNIMVGEDIKIVISANYRKYDKKERNYEIEEEKPAISNIEIKYISDKITTDDALKILCLEIQQNLARKGFYNYYYMYSVVTPNKTAKDIKGFIPFTDYVMALKIPLCRTYPRYAQAGENTVFSTPMNVIGTFIKTIGVTLKNIGDFSLGSLGSVNLYPIKKLGATLEDAGSMLESGYYIFVGAIDILIPVVRKPSADRWYVIIEKVNPVLNLGEKELQLLALSYYALPSLYFHYGKDIGAALNSLPFLLEASYNYYCGNNLYSEVLKLCSKLWSVVKEIDKIAPGTREMLLNMFEDTICGVVPCSSEEEVGNIVDMICSFNPCEDVSSLKLFLTDLATLGSSLTWWYEVAKQKHYAPVAQAVYGITIAVPVTETS